MTEQPPTGEEPTRIGNGPQQPPVPPPGQPGGWTPPSGPPAPQWGPPGAQPPGQPPYGQPAYGQQPPYGQPQQPQQPGQWGPPQQPANPYEGGYAQPGGPGYGAGPGGPGGPSGPQGGWTPMSGGPAPRKSKVGLIVAAAVAAIVLIGGGVTAAVVLTGDDDKDSQASEKSSQSDEPTEGTESTDPETDSPETDTPESPDPDASGETFTPTSLFDVSQVCLGKAMAGATPFDKATAKASGYVNTPANPEYGRNISIGYDEPWDVEFKEFAQINLVVCVDGTPSTRVQSLKCEAEVDGKKTKYTYAPYDYTVVFREAATGQVIHEAGILPEADDDCPMFAFIVDGTYTPSADSTAITDQVKAFLAS
ncbi:hypothetical protein ACLM5J_01045 [Nocardioides sp. Bht2]|uniref:hypothetical protein n=1 Tax=Nocardioides sp. Bht2 TaxID=3392297 RepID=UPI0039B3F757